MCSGKEIQEISGTGYFMGQSIGRNKEHSPQLGKLDNGLTLSLSPLDL